MNKYNVNLEFYSFNIVVDAEDKEDAYLRALDCITGNDIEFWNNLKSTFEENHEAVLLEELNNE